MHYHTHTVATNPDPPYEELTMDFDFNVYLENGWELDDIQDELEMLLSQVKLDNRSHTYPIEGETRRALNPLGESITVTHEGPTPGNALRIVYTSNGAWNWASNGPCEVAANLNDIVNTAGEAGVDSATGEFDVPVGAEWLMMKSAVRLPAGSYTKTVKTYNIQDSDPVKIITPDTTSWGDFYGEPPVGPNNDRGGELYPDPIDSAVSGAGKIVQFAPGAWISWTSLAAGP